MQWINAELESLAADPSDSSVSTETRESRSLLPLAFQAGIYFFPSLFLQSETPSRSRELICRAMIGTDLASAYVLYSPTCAILGSTASRIRTQTASPDTS